MKTIISTILFSFITLISTAQTSPFEKFDFLIGNWSGNGEGFGNEKSNINSSFQLIMNGKYIEVKNESKFEPTAKNPEGEHHIDKGFISFDGNRKKYVFRQFNNEGYVNRYILVDSLSSDSYLVFETEDIENFLPGGNVRWTIRKVDDNNIETTFEVSFPDKDYVCFGTNLLTRLDK